MFTIERSDPIRSPNNSHTHSSPDSSGTPENPTSQNASMVVRSGLARSTASTKPEDGVYSARRGWAVRTATFRPAAATPAGRTHSPRTGPHARALTFLLAFCVRDERARDHSCVDARLPA